MQHKTKKAIAKQSGYLQLSGATASNPFRNSSAVKKMFLVCLTFLIFSSAYSQKLLKITHMKQTSYNTADNKWNEWPTEWSTYQAGGEPVMSLFMLDDSGYKFEVYVKTAAKEFTFDVTYAGFDANNNWSKYKDVNGDEVDITGSNMSNLSQYGWPDTTVYIYFWIYSQSTAYEYY
jgi:hypothetical protein